MTWYNFSIKLFYVSFFLQSQQCIVQLQQYWQLSAKLPINHYFWDICAWWSTTELKEAKVVEFGWDRICVRSKAGQFWIEACVYDAFVW